MSDTNGSTDQYGFLTALAAGCPKGLHFLVAQKVMAPGKDGAEPREVFPAEKWREQQLVGPWYFSTGASNHTRHRRKETTKALRAIVLDDVGTKVERAAVKATPTWVLETSKGNFQLGFLLEWTDDIHGGDELFNGLIAAGLQDPGVRTSSRLFRIPDSLNDKKGRGNFKAVLHSFDADIVYTLDSLAEALGVTPGKLEPPRLVPADLPAAGMADPIFDLLAERGMVRHAKSNGWYEITCPFAEEHTDGRDDSNYLPVALSHTGCSRIECMHGHGQGDNAPDYERRFWAKIVEWGGPQGPIRAPASTALHDVLAKIAADMKAKPAVRKQTYEPADMFNIGTLADALGRIPITALSFTDRTKEGYSKIQPVTFGNIEAGLRTLGVQVRLNLLNAKTSYILPPSIDMARFGTKSVLEIDGLIEGALVDLFTMVGMRNKKELRDGFARIANSLYWHPAKDWIESIPWDGKDRFEALAATVSTTDQGLWKKYLRRWLLQGVEAACGWERKRESQKGLVLVLVGSQRIGKTSWLLGLAPGYSKAGKNLNLNGAMSRDSRHEALQGMIVELGELDATFKRSDISALKAFITDVTDEYRLPYAADWLTRPRCTSFCGSVNEGEFLNDPTGSGRFLPVNVLGRPVVDHGIDMQQLWAQVRTWWGGGEQHWLTAEEEELQTGHSVQFQTIDSVAEQIAEEIAEREEHRDAYPLECSVNAGSVAKLLNLRWDDLMVCRRVANGLRKHLGDKKDLRKRGGGARAWPFWLNRNEKDALKAVLLKPRIKP